jgi:hypothetical protein
MHGRKFTLGNYGYARFAFQFTGVKFKNSPTDIWKWESLVFATLRETESYIPPCFTLTAVATVAGPVLSPSGAWADWTASLTATGTVTIAMTNLTETKTISEPHGARYYASDF